MYWLITTGITRPNVRQNPNMWWELNHVNDKRKQVRDWVNAYTVGCGGICNNRTIVPRKEIQWHNGTPQEKFKGLAGFGHKREDNEVPHKCHVYSVGAHMWASAALQSRGEAHRLYPCFVWGMGMLRVVFNIEVDNYYSKSTLLRL